MTSLGEVQRIIGLSLSKIQMGRNQRGGLPLHKNLLVATVLNKARDVYMQETMYMNYRLMACGQFNQEEHEDIEDDDTPDTEDYEEDSESDVEDDNDNSATKEYPKEFVGMVPNSVPLASTSKMLSVEQSSSSTSSCCITSPVTSEPVLNNNIEPEVTAPELHSAESNNTCVTRDEGFIDENDCDCDQRNFSDDSENRVPFQYCFSCAPFHPSNGRGPTLVGPQLPLNTSCPVPQPVLQEQEAKLIYDMDLKSTQNQPVTVRRKRQISCEETEDAINSILPKRRRESSGGSGSEDNLDDSGFQEEEKAVFHPAFRDQATGANGMEVDQITSLVSIFSFGQQVFTDTNQSSSPTHTKKKSSSKDEDDSDSDSDTSSDSGHSSDDHDTNSDEKQEDRSESLDHNGRSDTELTCTAQAKEKDLDVSSVSVATAV